MRRPALGLVLLSVALALPPALALAPALAPAPAPALAPVVGPFIVHDDVSLEPVECAPVATMETVGFGPDGFAPRCASVASGGTLTFRFAPRVHEAASDRDARLPLVTRCFDTTGALVDDEEVPVSFRYDGLALSASVAGGAWRDCPLAPDRAQSTAERAVVQVLCPLHPHMKGMLLVEA